MVARSRLPGQGGNHGRVLEGIGVQVIAQAAHAAVVTVDVFGAVEHGARGVILGVLAGIVDLLGDFGPIAGRVACRGQERDAVAGIVMTPEVVGDVAPPLGQRTERIGRMVGLPVELRRYVVDGALFEPGQRVAEYAVVLPVAARGAGGDAMLGRRCAACAGHTRGADAEAHLGLHLLYHIIYVGNHHIDIVATPVGKGHVHVGVVPQVVVLGAAVGGNAVGIKVVVEDDAVHVIVGDDFLDDVDDALAGFGQAGIEDGGRGAATGIGQQHARIFQLLVLLGIPVGAGAPAVGIDPCVALDAAGMALLDGVG